MKRLILKFLIPICCLFLISCEEEYESSITVTDDISYLFTDDGISDSYASSDDGNIINSEEDTLHASASYGTEPTNIDANSASSSNNIDVDGESVRDVDVRAEGDIGISVVTPYFDNKLDSYTCQQIAAVFKDAGFVNIECLPIEAALVNASDYSDEAVVDILVGEDVIYIPSKSYNHTDRVRIFYFKADGNNLQVYENDINNLPQNSNPTSDINIPEAHVQVAEDLVWISKTGSKYHSTPSCSNMKSPDGISLSDAASRGLEPCKRCYK